MTRRPPRSTLFPSTTLSRSLGAERLGVAPAVRQLRDGRARDDDGQHLGRLPGLARLAVDRKSTRLNSSHANISYAVFCLKKKKSLPRLRSACCLLWWRDTVR